MSPRTVATRTGACLALLAESAIGVGCYLPHEPGRDGGRDVRAPSIDGSRLPPPPPPRDSGALGIDADPGDPDVTSTPPRDVVTSTPPRDVVTALPPRDVVTAPRDVPVVTPGAGYFPAGAPWTT